MVLQAFVDESYENSGIFALSGYVSTAEAWAKFSELWEPAIKEDGAYRKDGGRHFKMRQMWHPPERLAKMGRFHQIIQDHALMGIVFLLDTRHLTAAVDRVSVDGVRFHWKDDVDPYYISLRLLLEMFHRERGPRAAHLPLPDEPVDFYFDEHTKKGTVRRMWADFEAVRSDADARLFGNEPRFEKDEDFLPLQAADFLAWWYRRWAMKYGLKGTAQGDYEGFTPSPKKIPHMIIPMDEDELTSAFMQWATQGVIAHGLDPAVHVVRDKKSPA